jgi:hypothetical protein
VSTGSGDALNRLTTPVERSATTIEKRLVFKSLYRITFPRARPGNADSKDRRPTPCTGSDDRVCTPWPNTRNRRTLP